MATSLIPCEEWSPVAANRSSANEEARGMEFLLGNCSKEA